LCGLVQPVTAKEIRFIERFKARASHAAQVQSRVKKLDMATKEMLITALSQYEGAMLFVSHDRRFLAALSNRVLELTPEGFTGTGAGLRSTWRAPGTRRRG
jgi:ABC transporter ATP-binding protein